MAIDRIVINASPLIALFCSGQADLLPALFTRIIVPEAVWQEVVAEKGDAAAMGLPRQAWPIREPVDASPRVASWNLGRGETGVPSDALMNSGVGAVIDDRDARRCAQALGVPMLGTGGLLLLAKRGKVLPSVGEALNRIRSAGLWISDDIVELIRSQAGE